ncbi:conserved Plasmodium protein, unknown function [Plasmodium knowlesi strain H]|uniref:Uncharacterized protein n=3 Tax=Plasmodium knowlesi TaxID=5850 RepID=A0A5K1U2C6_PLAKH|nr:conserved Plasmodium protein, unknown function [Plasmodium knowlesi strain H]OTN68689.1 Uncharacterized protein PKNOH_S01011900 [Plasmodium knowlesi]CAA9986120.1 conserved Plasmodium protein, unknown function [Plasmodium knowlesi strain H]SBO25289.1 conserved Plasmodium protein, unknown function [Plasmodium knowlesi strain H]SBO27616.1 conserved Plasmodium protein, unknown function [Plasmodium knowlesi strain H]VVS75594.1 conserved Plasmodium protein, unknown function [Plasmodium knowlesi s|eukprot:XP_002257531.1 hypothetical protein, conserved in Plasmodium species [Plasmodium knowlesi strain H]
MPHNDAAYHHEGKEHMQISRKVVKHTLRRKRSDSYNGSMRDIYSEDGQAKKGNWGEEEHCEGSQMESHTPPKMSGINAELSRGRCPFRNSYVHVLYFKKLKLNKKLFEKMKNKNIVIYLKYKETTCTSKDIQVTGSEIANLYLSFLITEPLVEHEKQIIKIYIKYFKDNKYKILSFGFVELNFHEFTEKFYKKKSYMLCYDKNNNKYIFGYFVLLLANQIKWTICSRKISHEFIDKSYFVWDRNNYDHQIFYICKKIQSFLLQSVHSPGDPQGHAFQNRALLKHFGVTHSCPGTFRWRESQEGTPAGGRASNIVGEEEGVNCGGSGIQEKTEVSGSETHLKSALCGSLTRLGDTYPSEESDKDEQEGLGNQDDIIKKNPSTEGPEKTDTNDHQMEEPYESNEFNKFNESKTSPLAEDGHIENCATDEAETCVSYAALYDATHCLENVITCPFSSTEDVAQTIQKENTSNCAEKNNVERTNIHEECKNVEGHSDAHKHSELSEKDWSYSDAGDAYDETHKIEDDEPLEENTFDLMLCKKVENILNNDVDHFVEEVQFILTHLKKKIIKTGKFFEGQLKNEYTDIEVVAKEHAPEKGDMKNEKDEDIKKKKISIAHLTNGEIQSEQNCNIKKDILSILQNCVNTTSLYIKSVLKDKNVSKQEKDIFVVYDDIVDNIKKAISQFLLEDIKSHEQNLNISRMKSINLRKKKKEKKNTKKSQSESPKMCALDREIDVSSEMSISEGSKDQNKSYIGIHVSTAFRYYQEKWKRKLSGVRTYV